MIDSYAQIEQILRNAETKRVRADFYSRHKAIINSNYELIGVCIPEIKKLVKKVDASARGKIIDEIISNSERSFESILTAGCLAAAKGDYTFTKNNLTRVIPLFDSWAHVDTVVPCLKWVDADDFLRDFDYLINEKNQYAVRFYIIFLMDYCINDTRIDIIENKLKSINYGDYYVDMGAAWLLSEILVKNYERGLEMLQNGNFSKFVHNKAIQKARESYRITDEQKRYLNTLKIK